MNYDVGEWTHVGWSYANGVSLLYKNGCLVMKQDVWDNFVQGWNVPDAIQFGRSKYGPDIRIDEVIDEVYIWEVKKSASVFSVLYLHAN